MFLYNDGESSHSIAKKFDVDHKTVLDHLYTSGGKIRSKSESMKVGLAKGRVNSIAKPHILPPHSKNLTCEKAYVFGVLAGDGWLDYSPQVRRCQIGLETIDEEFADEFRRCLYATYGIRASKIKITVKHPGWSDKYRVKLCCKAACEDLLNYGVSFKTKRWRVPSVIKNAPLDIQASYLRGFFDSDGCVDVNNQRVTGTSSCLQGLEDISILLRGFNIRFRITRQSKKKNVHNVKIQDRASVELFAKYIGFIVARRANKLQQLVTNYKLRITLSNYVLKLEPEMRRLRNLGLTYEEIAKRLNISMGTVWNHLNPRVRGAVPAG